MVIIERKEDAREHPECGFQLQPGGVLVMPSSGDREAVAFYPFHAVLSATYYEDREDD